MAQKIIKKYAGECIFCNRFLPEDEPKEISITRRKSVLLICRDCALQKHLIGGDEK